MCCLREIFKEIWPRYIESALYFQPIPLVPMMSSRAITAAVSGHRSRATAIGTVATGVMKRTHFVVTNTLRPEQNGWHVADDIWIFWISGMKILYFHSDFTETFSTSPVDNKSASVPVIAWQFVGDKLLPGFTMTKFATYVCVNSSPPGQNGRQFDSRHFQTHFLEWKCMNFD